MITTERCRIRSFKEKDMENFTLYRNDLEWMKHQGFKGLTQAEYHEVLFRNTLLGEELQLAVADRQSDEIIGDLYMRKEDGSFWIGYTIHPVYAGQGLMREAVLSFVEFLLKFPDCKEIVAGILKENVRSKNLLEKTGFKFAYHDEGYQEDVYRLCP